MFPILLPLVLLAPVGDDVAVVRVSGGASAKLALYEHGPMAPGAKTLTPVHASDLNFFRASGARPVRFVFGADVDGDGAQEIVVLRELKSGRYKLTTYLRPDVLFGNTSGVISSSAKDEIGAAGQYGVITSIGAVDVNGDGRDEAAIVRQVGDGTQRLEIRGLPKKKRGAMSDAFGSYLDVGHAPFDEVISAVGLDIDGDDVEEIAIVRRSMGLPDRIQVLRAPLSEDDLLGAPLMQATDSTPWAGIVRSIEPIDLDLDGIDEIALVRDDPKGSSIEVHGLPYDGALAAPLAVDLVLTPKGHDALFALLVLRGWSPPVGEPDVFTTGKLVGDYEYTLSHTISVGYGQFNDVTIGPVVGSSGNIDQSSTFRFDFTNGGEIQGPFAEDTMSIPFGQTAVVETPTGDVLTLNFAGGKVLFTPGHLEVQGTYSGTGHNAFGQSIFLSNGQFAFRRVFSE